jgi:hypothetical protein
MHMRCPLPMTRTMCGCSALRFYREGHQHHKDAVKIAAIVGAAAMPPWRR